MDVVVLAQCAKEIDGFPEEIKGDILDCTAKLRNGLRLSMPVSRPMTSLGTGIHELRLKDRSGQYRVVYFVKKSDAIYYVHAFKKKTQQTSQRNIDIAMKRIKQL